MVTKTSQIVELPVSAAKGAVAGELAERLKAIAGLSDVQVDLKSDRIRFRMANPAESNGQLTKVLDEIKSAGLSVPISQEKVDIYNLRCAACVTTLEHGLKNTFGIADARINFATQTGQVDFVEGVYNRKELLDDIRKIGYEAGVHADDGAGLAAEADRKHDLIIAAVGAVVVFSLHMGQHVFHAFAIQPGISAILQFLLTLPVLYAGRVFFADAFRQSMHRRANMNSLIALGSGSAFIYSAFVTLAILSGSAGARTDVYFETTALIIASILVGKYLEQRATKEARDAALGMATLIPQKALLLRADGLEAEVDVAGLKAGDVVVVRPGSSIPADGVVLEGETVADESMITGESMPVAKQATAVVIGGTVNVGNGIKIKVTRVGAATVLARMIRMVQDAQSEKAPIQRIADRVAAVFVPIVIGIALVTLILWALLMPGSDMVLLAPVAVLLVACPCAMGLATPTAILVGTGRAARLGVLFRNGAILEELTRVSTVVFDKTGTLTEGKPTVDRVIPAEGATEYKVVQYAATAERFSEHPFAAAIRARAARDGSKLFNLDGHTNVPGQGIVAEAEGRRIVVGRRSFVAQSGLAEEQIAAMKNLEKDESTAIVHVAVDGIYVGAVCLSDTLKNGAFETVADLNRRGIETMMLTGDNAFSAAAIAAKAGIARVEADALPENKLLVIRSLKRTGRITAMVGDGVNDAAALTAADIGISLGTGTDVAVKASDITITGKSLSAIITALNMAQATLKIIKQNLFWAFFYNVIMIPVAAGALYPVIGLTFSPVMAAAAMALSSVFVVTNSLRLKNISPSDSNTTAG